MPRQSVRQSGREGESEFTFCLRKMVSIFRNRCGSFVLFSFLFFFGFVLPVCRCRRRILLLRAVIRSLTYFYTYRDFIKSLETNERAKTNENGVL